MEGLTTPDAPFGARTTVWLSASTVIEGAVLPVRVDVIAGIVMRTPLIEVSPPVRVFTMLEATAVPGRTIVAIGPGVVGVGLPRPPKLAIMDPIAGEELGAGSSDWEAVRSASVELGVGRDSASFD